MEFFLSEVPFPPQNILVDFVWGAIGVLSATALILVVIVNWKKAFGRVPSLDVIISGLMTAKEFESYKQEQHLRDRGLEEQIGKVRHDTSDALMGVISRSEERDKEMRVISGTIERLQERTETHIRKIDQFDGKIDNLLKEVAQAARSVKR